MTTLSRRHLLALAAAAPLAAGLAGRAQAATHEVIIEGMAFRPAQLTIARGDTVRFTNRDSMPHTATFRAAGLDTGRLNRGGVGELTFSIAGSFDYVCALHASMRGTVVVA